MVINLKNLTLGFLAGIASIIPGISGSALLITFNLYDKIIKYINNIFKNPKESIKFLTPIAIGITLGIILFSNILNFLIKKYSLSLSIIFIFLIISTLPNIINKINIQNKKNIIYFFLTFSIGISLLLIKNTILISLNKNIITFFIMGIILSISTIIPGISTTILFNLFGVYTIYLNALSTLNIKILIPIFIGFIITTFLLSKLINYLLTNHKDKTYLSILGFTISTIPSLFLTKIEINNELFIGLILGIIILFLVLKALKRLNNEH